MENFISAQPNKKSSEDSGVYKVRYAYMPLRKSEGSRMFCKRMENFTERDIVFRKEDINQMSFSGVNKELGHRKQNYSLLKFKGGKNCKHWWELRVYKKKGIVSVDDAVDAGMKAPTNPDEISVRSYDMPNRGAYPK